MSATPEQNLRDILGAIDTDSLPNPLPEEVEYHVRQALAYLGDKESEEWILREPRCPHCGGKVAVQNILKWYTQDIFTPLSEAEMLAVGVALQDCPVAAASDRLHAGWVRHLVDLILKDAEKEAGLPDFDSPEGWWLRRSGEQREALYLKHKTDDESCRIQEYDGAFRCWTHDRTWGATTDPDEPCAGWTPEENDEVTPISGG